ncbi:MAG: hypothetical protein ACKN9X_06955, partial [Candidatus Methylopumilus sp.]
TSETLRKLYPFHLLKENCTTEVFTILNSTYDENKEKISSALGGYIDGKKGLNFIPFVAGERVRDSFKIKKINIYPSFRFRKLETLSKTENSLLLELKESNTRSFVSRWYSTNLTFR